MSNHLVQVNTCIIEQSDENATKKAEDLLIFFESTCFFKNCRLHNIEPEPLKKGYKIYHLHYTFNFDF